MNEDKIDITVIVGLPGSGKSTFALKLINDNNFLIDDFSLNRHLLEDFKKSGKKELVITDPLLCETTQERAEKKLKFFLKNENINFKWVLFENDLKNCWTNVFEREDNREISYNFVKELSKKYEENYFYKNQENVIDVFKKEAEKNEHISDRVQGKKKSIRNNPR